MYKVIRKFKDLRDDGKIYNVGDEYPRKGYKPTEKRVAELLGKRNKIGVSLLKEVEESREKPASNARGAKKKPANKKAGS